jgi:3-deoxy-D-manno-octulosonic-acid transferase
VSERSLALSAYLAFSALSEPLWRLAMAARVRRGKEDPERVGEKFARAMAARPPGRLFWFHALSVGESLALLPLLNRIARDAPDATLLLTTSTRTSAQALARVGLPADTIHQFLPVDAAGPVRRFLDHWRPDLAVVTELDLWPRLLVEVSGRGVPLALINSRISPRNAARRNRGRGLFADLLARFDLVLAQDDDSAARFRAFGVAPERLHVFGALKAAAAPLPCDEGELERLRAGLARRPCWLAASSERREAGTLCAAQAVLVQSGGDHVLILAPRNVADGDGAAAAARARKLKLSRRSAGDSIGPETQVYLADTIGEMGLWYRLAEVVFMGHSLSVPGPEQRGKNPFEAALLDRPVLHGPQVGDFAETYAALSRAGAARLCDSAEAIAAAVRDLHEPAARAAMVLGARGVIAERRAVLDRTWGALAALL